MHTIQVKEGAMMSDFENLIKTITNIENVIQQGAQNGLKQAGARVMATAKSKLGTYQPGVGEYPAWQTLKPQTVKRKYFTKKGNVKQSGKKYLKKYGSFAPSGAGDDSPLVSTGHLRQAITTDDSEIEKGNIYVGVAGGNVATYGAAQEYGSAKRNIPPRPYLRPSVVENKEQIEEDIKNGITEMMSNFK
ncbi:hypothetical protein AAK894_14435 [Lachnospiraceae bacterium 46-61]